jgi:hypothetical protein
LIGTFANFTGENDMNIIDSAIAHATSMGITQKNEWCVFFGNDTTRTGKLAQVSDQVYFLACDPPIYFTTDKVVFLYPYV